MEFKVDIEILAGGRYQNDYLGTFRPRNGQVVEHTEYFNPLVNDISHPHKELYCAEFTQFDFYDNERNVKETVAQI